MQVSVSMRENSLGQRMAEEPVSWEMSYLVDLPYMAFLVGAGRVMARGTAVKLSDIGKDTRKGYPYRCAFFAGTPCGCPLLAMCHSLT